MKKYGNLFLLALIFVGGGLFALTADPEYWYPLNPMVETLVAMAMLFVGVFQANVLATIYLANNRGYSHLNRFGTWHTVIFVFLAVSFSVHFALSGDIVMALLGPVAIVFMGFVSYIVQRNQSHLRFQQSMNFVRYWSKLLVDDQKPYRLLVGFFIAIGVGFLLSGYGQFNASDILAMTGLGLLSVVTVLLGMLTGLGVARGVVPVFMMAAAILWNIVISLVVGNYEPDIMAPYLAVIFGFGPFAGALLGLVKNSDIWITELLIAYGFKLKEGKES